MFRPYTGRARSFRARPQRSFQPRRAFIKHDRYINTAVPQTQQEVYVNTYTFDNLGLDQSVLANIKKHGYTNPTPIQDQAIPALMEGKDVVGIANTGTGKTAAFLLPFIHKALQDPDQGVMIIAPTRELAVQINDEFKAFAQNLPLSVTLCIGGGNLHLQMKQLRDNPHFVIGTPGRLKDVIQRGVLRTEMFSNIVLDEVDRMLDIGFRKDIKFLIAQLPEQRHSAFFSATMNYETEEIMHDLSKKPVRISVKKTETNNHIDQSIISVKPGENKVDVLHKLLSEPDCTKAIVFGRTKHGINKLEKLLFQRGLRVTAIHGNKNQNARQRSLQDFKRNKVQALLATDVAARGIDVDDVTHVINYDEPQTYDDYVHRIGRTGRAGKMGKAITFIN